MSDKELDNRTLAQVLDDEKFGPDDAAMSDKELKPCPFCGGEAKQWYENEFTGFAAFGNDEHVGCENCGIDFSSYTEEGAIKAWNTRTEPVDCETCQHMQVIEVLESKLIKTKRTEPEWKYSDPWDAWADLCGESRSETESFKAGFNAARELK